MNDPDRDELIEAIENAGEGATDFEIEEAIWWFANDWYSSRYSNLYNVLRQSQYHPGPLQNGPSTPASRHIYDWLCLEFQRKVN
jgi:hypothetical protein